MPKVVPEYKAQARQRIVDAAVKVFETKGFSSTTMDDIASEVGVSKGALYLYFANKTELLKAIQAAGRELVTRRMTRLEEEGDIAEGLSALVEEFFAGGTDRQIWNELLVEAQSDPKLRDALREDWEEDYRALRSFLERLRANRRIPQTLDLDTTTSLLISVLEHAAGMYLLGFDPRDARKTLLTNLRAVLGVGSARRRAH